MSSLQLIQNFIKTESLQKASMTSLKPGQLLYGRIEKFLPNNTAIVQIGSMKLVAQLKASLSTAENYIFEVQANSDNGIQLKVLEGNAGQTANFLDLLRLPDTKANIQLLQLFIDNHIPFTTERLTMAAAWIPNKPDAKELQALEWMAKKDLPFTKQIFQSLVAVQEPQSFSSQLERLGSHLENPKFAAFETVEPLKQMINAFLQNHSFDGLENGTDVKQMLENIMHSLGLDYEKEVGIWAGDKENSIPFLHSLKPLLLSALQELGPNGRELEPVLNRLTGMQLISQDSTAQMQQMVMQLPISFGNKKSDVTLQWSGRKNSKGQMDSDYCRILFYLDLQHLNQTIIDMQVQNRVIHVTIINERKEIEPIVKAFTPNLKQKLEALGYKLSFIKVNPADESVGTVHQQIKPLLFPKEFYQGVDIKI